MSDNKGIILVVLPKERFGSSEMEALRSQAEGREIVHITDRSEIEKILDKIEILIGDAPWDLLAEMPNLRWLQTWSAGVDGLIAHPELINHRLIITNTSGMHRDQLAEHIFAMILSRNRYFPKVFAAQQRHEWIHPEGFQTDILTGKTMLIIGYGKIGEQAAIAAKAFGMKVIGIRRRPANPGAGVRIETMDKLHELLGEADYVVNILPFTNETKGILGKKEFSLFKRGAVYVNVGRGLTNDEDAMIEALKSGRLAAALLDVTAVEPLPKDSPLWDMKNVIITPHYAGTRNDYAKIAAEITVENLKRYNKGQPLEYLVDKKTGY
jgi:phosphoglycerate dehydrogenase-like enzyme